jgi:spoIIIJ-associated protein
VLRGIEEEAMSGDETMESKTAEAAADEQKAEDAGLPTVIAAPMESQAVSPSDPVVGTAADEDTEEAPISQEPFVEDGRADKALDFVVELLTAMGLDCTVDLMENDDSDPASDIRIEVTGKDSHRLIGKKGQTLAALQFLTSRVVNRPHLTRRHVLIDADGYRARRESALSTMAQRLGAQAVAEGKIITFEPMSAQDRRVVRCHEERR